jgi:hypothetical protein
MGWMRLLWLGTILLAGGCAPEISPPACLVSGSLVVNAQPAAGACVRFHSTEETMQLPEATFCEPDGTFSLALQEPGEYSITFFWPSITVEEGEEIQGPDRLRGKFKNPVRSKRRVTLVEGANQLEPIEVRANLRAP